LGVIFYNTQFSLSEDTVLSNTSRVVTYLTAILYAILGVLPFFLPEQRAPVFTWKVTPFEVMSLFTLQGTGLRQA
jgi:hypothetical protein